MELAFGLTSFIVGLQDTLMPTENSIPLIGANNFLSQGARLLPFYRHMELLKYFDAYSQRHHFWSDHYLDHSKENHKQIIRLVGNGTYKSMNNFYGAIGKLLKPRKMDKALKDAKMRTTQKQLTNSISTAKTS